MHSSMNGSLKLGKKRGVGKLVVDAILSDVWIRQLLFLLSKQTTSGKTLPVIDAKIDSILNIACD